MPDHGSVESPAARHLSLLATVTAERRDGRTHIRPAPGATPVVVVPWHSLADVEPVAFIGCFTDATHHYVFPLKAGVNRIGRSPHWGDHAETPATLMESRQWLIVCRGVHAIVADDHSTNGSALVPHGIAAHAFDPDPRYSGDVYSYPAIVRSAPPGVITLDWQGTVTPDISEGDVLLTMYGAFVYGLLPLGSSKA